MKPKNFRGRKQSRRQQALKQRKSEANKYEHQLESISARLKSQTNEKLISQLEEKQKKLERKLSIANEEIETLKNRV